MLRTVALVGMLALAAAACSSEKSGGDEPAKKKTDEPKKKKKSNVKRVVTAVPTGAKVKCTDLLPDLSKFKEYVAEDISDEIVEKGKTIVEAAASCALKKAGEPPQNEAQQRALKKANLKLGVIPGDVYCQVTLYCSLATDDDTFKKKCEASMKKEEELGTRTIYEGNMGLGQFACVRKTDRPPNDYAYTYRTIDKKTKCVFEVMGGPSVVSGELVQNCTKAALESIGPEHLKNFK